MTDKPIWIPLQERIENSLILDFARKIERETGESFMAYENLHTWSVTEISQFWGKFWDWAGIKGDKGDIVIDNPELMIPGARFFPNGRINYAENMLVKNDDSIALIFWGEDKVKRQMSWRELNDKVSQAEQMMRSIGIQFGDRVASYLPNGPESIIALLASAHIGAIFTTASPDFGVTGVLDRFGQIEPKLFLSPDGYWYNGKWMDCTVKGREIAEKLGCIHQQVGYDGAWAEIDAYAPKNLEFTRHPFNHPLYILFSSGTTGIPKCIVHSTGGAMLQHIKEHRLQCDVHKTDNIFFFTTCSWMMWHWLVSGLASAQTLLLYDGSPFVGNGRILFEYADAHQMSMLGTSAKFIDALRKVDWLPKDEFKLDHLRTLPSTGSPLVHESYDYILDNIKRDIHIVSESGGTDIVSCFMIGNVLSPVYRGELQGAGLGYDIVVMDDDGKLVGKGEGQGELVCRRPFPCMPVQFWGDTDNEKYKDAYFNQINGVWCHGDWIEQTAHGGFIIYGRSDATLNPQGVRIGTAEIYRQVEKIPEVLESICVGQDWDNDVRVVLFVVLREGIMLNEDIQKRIKDEIRSGASPRHVPAKIVQVTAIPRTRSGKIVELAVRNVIMGRPVKNIEALSNPEALELYKNLSELSA